MINELVFSPSSLLFHLKLSCAAVSKVAFIISITLQNTKKEKSMEEKFFFFL